MALAYMKGLLSEVSGEVRRADPTPAPLVP
jgi:hypothetical protein